MPRCPFCSHEVPLDSTRCVHCGIDFPQPPANPAPRQATKRCPFCAEEIQEAAILCRYCQRPLTAAAATATIVAPARTWSPGTAAVLSFLIPGLGQIYKGEIAIGLVLLVLTIGGYLLLIIPGLLLHLFAIVHAYGGGTVQRSTASPTAPAVTEEERRRRAALDRKNLIRFAVLIAGLVLVGTIFVMIARPPAITRRFATGETGDTARWEETLRLMVTSTGERCPSVVQAFHQGVDPQNGNFWNLKCSNGSAFSIQLVSGHAPKVIECDVLRRIAKVDCFKRFDGQ